MKTRKLILATVTASLFAGIALAASDSESYSCVFEDGTYVNTDVKGKKLKIVTAGNEKTVRVAWKGSSISWNEGLNSLSTSFGSVDGAETVSIDYPVENGDKKSLGVTLEANLSVTGKGSVNGTCIWNP